MLLSITTWGRAKAAAQLKRSRSFLPSTACQNKMSEINAPSFRHLDKLVHTKNSLNISNIVFSRTRTSSNSNEHKDRYSWDKKKWCLNIYSWWIQGFPMVPMLLIIFSVLCEGPPRHVYRTHQDVQGPYTIHSCVRIWIYMYICAHIKPQKDRTVFPGCCRWLRHIRLHISRFPTFLSSISGCSCMYVYIYMILYGYMIYGKISCFASSLSETFGNYAQSEGAPGEAKEQQGSGWCFLPMWTLDDYSSTEPYKYINIIYIYIL